MNAKRFLQLVNLHIDQEISPEELEELEAEVARNPQRREIHRQYCRLQNASKTVYQEFGCQLAQSIDLKKYQILARESGKRLRLGLLYTAGSLTAACLAVVAAVSVFQEAQWGPQFRTRSAESNSDAVVEVFDNRPLDRSEVHAPGPEVMAAEVRFPLPSSRRTEMMESIRTSARAGFQLSVNPALWEEEFRAGSPARVFRSSSSFEPTELVSFQFQR